MRRAHKTWPAGEYFARKTSAPPALASGNAPSVTLPENVPVANTLPALSVPTAVTWSELAPPIDRAQVLGPAVLTVTFMTSLAAIALVVGDRERHRERSGGRKDVRRRGRRRG